jgi:Predicted branched-chain amino acid permease (azaleucine resistance)
MARVIDAGGEVTVVAATNGENGTSDRLLYGSARFGALRQLELRASLAELGVTDARFLGVPDGGCAAADDATAVQALVDIIASVQPDTIVTFGPDGITGHPDHTTVSRWVTEAWRATRTAELHYAAMTDDHVSEHAELHAALGLFTEFGNGGPVSVGRSELSLECTLDDAELVRKRRALARHRTQTESLAAQIGEDTFRTWWRNETFRSPTPAEARTVRSVMCQGARDITPMVVGLVPFALAVGAVIAASSVDRGPGLASGPVVLGGSAQLAMIQMLGSGAAPVVIIVSALFINARILLYSASLAPWFADLPLRRRLLLAVPVIDQLHFTCVPRFERGDLDQRDRTAYYVGAAVWLMSAWVVAQAGAVMLGARLPAAAHLDIAAPLALAGLLAKSTASRPSIVAAVAAMGFVVVGARLPWNSAVLIATLAAIGTALVIDRVAAVRTSPARCPS